MKRFFFIFFIFFVSINFFASECKKPTDVILSHFWQADQANTVSQNVVPLQDNKAAIYFIEEKLIHGELFHEYKTWISSTALYDELLDAEKNTFVGFMLKRIADADISAKACTYIDEHTACTKVADGYECTTVVAAYRVELKRVLDKYKPELEKLKEKQLETQAALEE